MILQSIISKLQSLWGYLFCQNVQNFICISKLTQEMHKKGFVFEIIASEFVSLKCLSYEEDTIHWQPMR